MNPDSRGFRIFMLVGMTLITILMVVLMLETFADQIRAIFAS